MVRQGMRRGLCRLVDFWLRGRLCLTTKLVTATPIRQDSGNLSPAALSRKIAQYHWRAFQLDGGECFISWPIQSATFFAIGTFGTSIAISLKISTKSV